MTGARTASTCPACAWTCATTWASTTVIPVGDDEWLETLREGDKLRWGRWTAPFETVRRYLVTGQVDAGRNRKLAHDMIVTAMTQINRFGANATIFGDQPEWQAARGRGQRADGALRAGSPLG